MRVSVVMNPFAGGRRSRRFDYATASRLVERVVADFGATVTTVLTDCPDHACGRAREALDSGADLVIAWGGDGTVNEVASVLAGTAIRLGVVPAGSGNGLGRELGIPADHEGALRVALAGRTRVADMGRLNERVFVNVAGFGFDAHIAARFNAAGHARGLRQYVRLTVRELMTYEPSRYAVQADGGDLSGVALLLAFANSRQYGNGASIAPTASIDDGWLDAVMVAPTSRLGDVWRARRLFTGSILRDPRVRSLRVRAASVEGDAPLLCHVDGEPFLASTPARIAVWPGALRVCTGGG